MANVHPFGKGLTSCYVPGCAGPGGMWRGTRQRLDSALMGWSVPPSPVVILDAQETSPAPLALVFFFFGPFRATSWHMEVPSLGIESVLQLLAYATVTAVPDPSHICDLHHSSRPHCILNSLSEARN